MNWVIKRRGMKGGERFWRRDKWVGTNWVFDMDRATQFSGRGVALNLLTDEFPQSIRERCSVEEVQGTPAQQARALADEDRIVAAMADAESKAWDALARYKFWMFGYHAGRWVNYNNLLAVRRPSPFADAVVLARHKCEKPWAEARRMLEEANGEDLGGDRGGEGLGDWVKVEDA